MTFNGSGSSDPDPGDSLHYKWDLDGNGSFETDTGTNSSTSRSYATAQSITVRLRVTDNLGATNDSSHQLTVNSPSNQAPTASFTMSPNPAQSGEAVNFDGSTSRIQTRAGASRATSGTSGTDERLGPTTQHTYSTGVTTAYTVTLTVTDDANGVGSTAQTLQVTAPPPAAASASPGGSTGPTTGSTTSGAGTGTGAGGVVKPNVASLRVSPFAFHAARSGPPALAAIATGTRVSFVLSERASRTFRVDRTQAAAGSVGAAWR